MKRESNNNAIKVEKSIKTAMMVVVFVLIFSSAFAFLPQTTINAQAETITTGYVYLDDVNIRSGPGTNYQSLGTISYDYVIINGQAQGNDGYTWYLISYGAINGYIRGDLITDIKNTDINTGEFGVFPESYRESLALIRSQHPNYVFKPVYINYTLEETAAAHVGRKVYWDANWNLVNAPYSAIYYYMDPATYLNESDIFVFAEHYYNSSQNAEGVRNIVTMWGNCFLNKESYISALMEAGKKYGVSPYVLTATILQEKGWYADKDNPDVYGRKVYAATVDVPNGCLGVRTGPGTDYQVLGYVNDKETIYIYGLSKNLYESSDKNSQWYSVIYNGRQGYVCKEETVGTEKHEYVKDYREYGTYYNLFSINQTDSNPVFGGLSYSMAHDWTTPEKSLVDGAAFYKYGYVDNGQDTYYFKDFNVINDSSEWWHEYATGLQDPIESASYLEAAYEDDPNATVTFAIPVYEDYEKPVVTGPQIFPDVTANDWYFNSVNFVYEKGLMTGMGDGNFNPGGELSRAQFAVILWRWAGSPGATNTGYFADVAAGEWYTNAVYWAYNNGIVTGYSGTNLFGTSDSITREQFVTMLYRFAAYNKWSTGDDSNISGFHDAANVSDWANRAMRWAVARGIITGKNNGTSLDPQGITTRCECAEMIYRYY